MSTEFEMIKGTAKCETEKIISFLMVGQSNMAGRGDINVVQPIENPNCVMFRMGMWQPMTEPINIDKSLKAEFAPGIGLAASFADDMQKHTGKKIGLIPCAYGGSKIEQWLPGEALYDNAVFTAKLAMRTSTLGGIIWHQGESNCRGFDTNGYREKFLLTMNSLRKDLSAEELPLILGEISECIGERWNLDEWSAPFNRHLHEIASELPSCAVAAQNGLTLRPQDGIHFDSPSCREFGHRYFKKYMEITEK